MERNEAVFTAILGVLGGMAFIIGILLITPFLSQTEINFTSFKLWLSVASIATGIMTIMYSTIKLIEG